MFVKTFEKDVEMDETTKELMPEFLILRVILAVSFITTSPKSIEGGSVEIPLSFTNAEIFNTSDANREGSEPVPFAIISRL